MNRDDNGKESIPLRRAHHSADPTLDGLPGIFAAVLGIHPCQVPGSREEIRLGAVGSVVGCRERPVMLRDVVGSQQGRITSPQPHSPKWWVSSRFFMISAKSCGATRLRASRRAGRSARLETSLSRGEPGNGHPACEMATLAALAPQPHAALPSQSLSPLGLTWGCILRDAEGEHAGSQSRAVGEGTDPGASQVPC